MNESVGRAHHVLFWTIAIGGAAFDLVTKAVVFDRIGPPPSRPVSVIPNVLELHTNFNSGALWGFGRSLPHSSAIFAALSVFAALVILYVLFVRGGATDARLTAALGLIMAGAMGNCYDRVVLGHVRDFVHFHVDPINFNCAIFNFADNMLVAGAIILMLTALRAEHAEAGPPEDEARRSEEPQEAGQHAPSSALENPLPSA
jgi:signal peptidase II